jgi:uncharacterized protein (DUF2336 family)
MVDGHVRQKLLSGLRILLLSLPMVAVALAQPASESTSPDNSITNVIDVIRRIQTEPSPRKRSDLAEQLALLVRQAEPAKFDAKVVDDMAALLDDSEPSVRIWAAGALGNIGPYATRAVPALEKALREEEAASASQLFVPALGEDVIIRHALAKIRRQE